MKMTETKQIILRVKRVTEENGKFYIVLHTISGTYFTTIETTKCHPESLASEVLPNIKSVVLTTEKLEV